MGCEGGKEEIGLVSRHWTSLSIDSTLLTGWFNNGYWGNRGDTPAVTSCVCCHDIYAIVNAVRLGCLQWQWLLTWWLMRRISNGALDRRTDGRTGGWRDREAVQTENLIHSKLHDRKARLYLMFSKLGIILFKLQYKWQNLATLMKILNHVWNEKCAKPVLPRFTRRGHDSLKSQNSSLC